MFAFARIRKVLSIHDIMHETNSCPARLFTEQMTSSFMENIMHAQKFAHPRKCEHLPWLYPPKNEDGHFTTMDFNDVSCVFNLAYRSYCTMHLAKRMRIYLRNVINLRSKCE